MNVDSILEKFTEEELISIIEECCAELGIKLKPAGDPIKFEPLDPADLSEMWNNEFGIY